MLISKVYVCQVKASKDEKMLASCGTDKRIVLWQVAAQKLTKYSIINNAHKGTPSKRFGLFSLLNTRYHTGRSVYSRWNLPYLGVQRSMYEILGNRFTCCK